MTYRKDGRRVVNNSRDGDEIENVHGQIKVKEHDHFLATYMEIDHKD